MSKESICGIYKITNTIDGKVYIGQSIHIHQRWRQHKLAASNPNCGEYHLPLYEAFRKIGTKCFKFEILEQCAKDMLDEREQYYINYYKAANNKYGYNNSSTSHQTLSEAIVNQIVDALQNRALGIGEIAYICGVTISSVTRINQGTRRISGDYQYPLRNPITKAVLSSMGQVECRPSIDFRTNHTIEETYEEYKQICLTRFKQGDDVNILFDRF